MFQHQHPNSKWIQYITHHWQFWYSCKEGLCYKCFFGFNLINHCLKKFPHCIQFKLWEVFFITGCLVVNFLHLADKLIHSWEIQWRHSGRRVNSPMGRFAVDEIWNANFEIFTPFWSNKKPHTRLGLFIGPKCVKSENQLPFHTINIARGTTDPEIDSETWTKLGINMAPLALIANLATRWHHLTFSHLITFSH